jgi:hypothetical protein
MFRNKKQNQINLKPKRDWKKLRQRFSLAVLIAAFLAGGFLLITRKHTVTKKLADTVATGTLPGWWLQKYFGSSVCSAADCQPNADPDHDGLTNAQEYFYHTDPTNAHTVGDKMSDGELVAAGFDPSRPGHLTFDQVTSSQGILQDSLLLDSDIKQIVAESNDISKVSIPLVNDNEIKIIQNPTQIDYQNYLINVQNTIEKYFPQNSIASTTDLLKTANSDVSGIIQQASALSNELKTISVPAPAVSFHKYNIAAYQLLAQVIDPTDQTSDAWYDKAQAFFAVEQKLNLETQRLSKIITP